MLTNSSYRRAQRLFADRTPVWAHWRYEPDEWAQFIEKNRAKTKRDWISWFLLAGTLFMGMAIAGTLMSGSNPAQGGASFILICAFGWFLGFATMTYFWGYRPRAKSQIQLHSRPREVVVTPVSVSLGGTNIQLVSPVLSLTRVWVDPADPTVLRFRVKHWLSRSPPEEIWVPIPQNQKSQAEELVSLFQREIGTAS